MISSLVETSSLKRRWWYEAALLAAVLSWLCRQVSSTGLEISRLKPASPTCSGSSVASWLSSSVSPTKCPWRPPSARRSGRVLLPGGQRCTRAGQPVIGPDRRASGWSRRSLHRRHSRSAAWRQVTRRRARACGRIGQRFSRRHLALVFRAVKVVSFNHADAKPVREVVRQQAFAAPQTPITTMLFRQRLMAIHPAFPSPNDPVVGCIENDSANICQTLFFWDIIEELICNGLSARWFASRLLPRRKRPSRRCCFARG